MSTQLLQLSVEAAGWVWLLITVLAFIIIVLAWGQR